MRTLRDMNYSKLVTADINLFKELLNDIFPKVTNPGEKIHKAVEEKIKKVIAKNRLSDYRPWVLKII